MQQYLILLSLLLIIVSPVLIIATNTNPAPNINVPEPTHHFGDLTPDLVVSHDFIIENTGNAELVIQQIAASCICSKTELNSEKIQPGDKAALKIYLNTAHKLPGEFAGEIQVYSNDPDQPITRLLIKANIVSKISGNKALTPAWKNISPQKAREILKNPQTILVDVRNPEEYKKGHIPKSLLIPLYRLAAEAELQLTDKNAPIIVYCQAGIRSQKAAETLVQLGYTNVYDLGGIRDWPYKIEK